MHHDMTQCEKSRQLQDSLKLIQAELSRKTLNYFLEPVDLFSVPGANGITVQMNYQQMLMKGSSGNALQKRGSIFFFYSWICLWLLLLSMSLQIGLRNHSWIQKNLHFIFGRKHRLIQFYFLWRINFSSLSFLTDGQILLIIAL